MKLNTIAAIATIVGAIFAGASYFSASGANSVVGAKEPQLQQKAEAIKLTLDIPVYSGERNWLAAMYKAADDMPTYAAQQAAFKKVVAAALDVNDFNVALMAALEMPTYASRDEMLDLIIENAVHKKDTLDYAYFAANKYSTYAGKQKGLSRVIDAYELVIKEERNQKIAPKTEKHNKQLNEDSGANAPPSVS